MAVIPRIDESLSLSIPPYDRLIIALGQMNECDEIANALECLQRQVQTALKSLA
jgi:hypothetical protein